MSAPLIGLITYRLDSGYGFPVFALAEKYVEALKQVGALPVLIPLGLPEEALRDLLPRLDGVLFTGGGDIAIHRFGGETHERVENVDEDRDRIELQLMQDLLQSDMPLLGICRGIQVINVAMGGTLYTHIEDQHSGAIKHDYTPDYPRDQLSHTVTVDEGSRLAEILGEVEVEVNSMHHQGIKEVADGLQVTAHSPDGLVEGVEIPGSVFRLAVQWHPEWLPDHAPMRDLFAAFVRAASGENGSAAA